MTAEAPPNDEIWDSWAEARAARPGLLPAEFVARYGERAGVVLETLTTLLDLEELEPPPPLVDVTPGHSFAGFRLEAVLGEGSSGIVFEAIDEREGRSGARVALKALNPLVTVGSERRRSILREAEVAARLDHEGIVRVLDSGMERGYTWIVSELVEGQPLDDWIGAVSGDEASAQAIEIGLQLARALEHAHAGGVVHRDIKPANIIRTPEGRVRLLDFGLARAEGAAFAISRSGSAIGTPLYMAPEQMRGESTVGPGADLYALGLVLLEVARGQRLAAREHALKTMVRIARGKLRVDARLLRGIPRAIADVVSRCLEPAVEDRYPDAAALIADLEAVRAGRPLPIGRLGRLRRTWRAGNRHRARSAAAILLMILVVWIAVSLLTPEPRWTPAKTLMGKSPGDLFGEVMAGGGDFDGDGVPDYAIAANQFDSPETDGADEGAVWVYSGKTHEELRAFYGRAAGDTLGRVQFLGDIDGDGCDEVVMSAAQNGAGASKQGYLWVASYKAQSPMFERRGQNEGDLFGSDLHAGGDLDGDGFPDLIVGAQQTGNDESRGHACVYSGKTLERIWEVREDETSNFGHSVCIIGDLDLDGRSEFAVGDYTAKESGGRIHIYSGDSGTRRSVIDQPRGLLGAALRPAARLDREGLPVLVAGSPAFSGAGAVTLMSASTGDPLITHVGAHRDELGRDVAGLGDVDGDDVADFAAGAGANGYVVVLSGANGAEIERIESATPMGKVASAGDLDGDGLDDLLVSFPTDRQQGTPGAVGVVHLFLSGDRPEYSDSP